MKPATLRNLLRSLDAVGLERFRQDAKCGEQNHPDGTGPRFAAEAEQARQRCELAAEAGRVTWRHILDEEIAEAFAETDPERLATELVQVAAVAVAWVEAINRRTGTEPTTPIPATIAGVGPLGTLIRTGGRRSGRSHETALVRHVGHRIVDTVRKNVARSMTPAQVALLCDRVDDELGGGRYDVATAALEAREAYWLALGHPQRAAEPPSDSSRAAWEAAVRSVIGAAS